MNDDLKAKMNEFVDLVGSDTESAAKRKGQVSEYINHDKLEEAVALLVGLLRMKVEEYQKEQSEKMKEKSNGEKLFLAHYTSVETVFSIIENKGELRLYDAFYLNDPNEGKFFSKHLKDALAENYEWLEGIDDTDAFICSFVGGDKEIGDKLSYWHSYGKGGLGCSIRLSELHSQESVFHPVSYGEESVKNAVIAFEPLFKLGKEVHDCLSFLEEFAAQEFFAENFWKAFDEIKFMYKDVAYEHENEYRMVRVPELDADVKYELKSEGLYPYLRKYIADENLSTEKIFAINSKITAEQAKVTIGPAVRRAKHLYKSLKNLAEKRGVKGAIFDSSGIPHQRFW